MNEAEIELSFEELATSPLSCEVEEPSMQDRAIEEFTEQFGGGGYFPSPQSFVDGLVIIDETPLTSEFTKLYTTCGGTEGIRKLREIQERGFKKLK